MDVQDKLTLLLNHTDGNGKKLMYRKQDGQRVYLEIDGKERCLGHIAVGKKFILYYKTEDESNIFRKTMSWSINRTILDVVDDIYYETRLAEYHITKERALEFGQHFHFQDTTELKIYVPIKYWNQAAKGIQNLDPNRWKGIKNLGSSWYEVLEKPFNSPLINGIRHKLKILRESKVIVYPDGNRVFEAFRLSTFEHTKVVILGQDPYIDGTADGLAFSYLNGAKKKHDKSLDIIFKEIERDIYNDLHLGHDYELDHWARQGVLLLNTCLTVEKGKTLSHAKTKAQEGLGWERFTKIVVYELLMDKTPKVFALWGEKAKQHYQEVMEVVNKKHDFPQLPHLILTARHPAYDLRSKDGFGDVAPNYPETFSGCKHFSQINNFLKANGRKEIVW